MMSVRILYIQIENSIKIKTRKLEVEEQKKFILPSPSINFNYSVTAMNYFIYFM